MLTILAQIDLFTKQIVLFFIQAQQTGLYHQWLKKKLYASLASMRRGPFNVMQLYSVIEQLVKTLPWRGLRLVVPDLVYE
jgi:hypothetical protein